jgi:hypothetical protein
MPVPFLFSLLKPLSYSFQSVTEPAELKVQVAGLNLIVSGGGFCAVYYKSTDKPQLMLRLRTKTEDYELLARAWIVANRKARELGWILQGVDFGRPA